MMLISTALLIKRYIKNDSIGVTVFLVAIRAKDALPLETLM